MLVFSLIVISLTWLVMAMSNKTSNKAKEGTKTVEIVAHGNLVEKFTITEDAKNIYSFEFGKNTGYIEVKDGAVRMLEMDRDICPEGICSKTGWIKKTYETIVCMPNGIIVNIKNNENILEKNDDTDVIV